MRSAVGPFLLLIGVLFGIATADVYVHRHRHRSPLMRNLERIRCYMVNEEPEEDRP
jgi:hypothetical protein